MLTFKSAPKTLLGPCEHALWNGQVFLSCHHSHMLCGSPEEWRKLVEVMMIDDEPRKAVETMLHFRSVADSTYKVDPSMHHNAVKGWWDASRDMEDIFHEYCL
jgi:hypothetical protein